MAHQGKVLPSNTTSEAIRAWRFHVQTPALTLQDECHNGYLCNTILVKHDVVALKWVWHIYKRKDYGESHIYVS